MQVPLLFLHGIGNQPAEPTDWLESLNRRLSQLGYPAIESSAVIAPNYHAILDGESIPQNFDDPTKTDRRSDSSPYWDGQLRLIQQRLAQVSRVDNAYLAGRGPSPAIAGRAIDRSKLLRQVKKYQEMDGRVRRYVRARVIQELQDFYPRGPVIVLGHSLGSVIAVDLIRYLPEDITVQGLVTIASPLNWSDNLRKSFTQFTSWTGFPSRRVRGWANVYDERDIVPGGGLERWFEPVVDVRVDTGSRPGINPLHEHGIETYAATDGLARTIGLLMEPEVERRERSDVVPVNHVPLVLDFAYGHHLGGQLTSDRRQRFDAARLQAAARAVDSEPSGELTVDSLLNNPASRAKGRYNVPVLVAHLVGLWQYEPLFGGNGLESNRSSSKRRGALHDLVEALRADSPSSPFPATRQLVDSIVTGSDAASRAFHGQISRRRGNASRLFVRSEALSSLLAQEPRGASLNLPAGTDDRAVLIADLASELDLTADGPSPTGANIAWDTCEQLCVRGHPREARQLLEGLLAVVLTRRELADRAKYPPGEPTRIRTRAREVEGRLKELAEAAQDDELQWAAKGLSRFLRAL